MKKLLKVIAFTLVCTLLCPSVSYAKNVQETESNDSMNAANSIELGDVASGSISNYDFYDWYTINLQEGYNYRLIYANQGYLDSGQSEIYFFHHWGDANALSNKVVAKYNSSYNAYIYDITSYSTGAHQFEIWFDHGSTCGLTQNYTFSVICIGDNGIPMYRLYNPNSGEHFYTSNSYESDSLKKAGWSYEGIAWYAPHTGSPVYRLYNANAGDHHYTLNSYEKDNLVKLGWKYEGIAWYSGGSVPMYRAYNPNATAGSHHYTKDTNEINSIVAQGWRNEGLSWYAVK